MRHSTNPTAIKNISGNNAKHHHASIHLPCGVRGLLWVIVSIAVAISGVTTWSLWHVQQQSHAIHSSPSKPAGRKHNQTFEIQSSKKDLADDQDTSVTFHFMVSSECSSYQLWETLTQFHAAEAVQQCGRFTWIVSGCLPDDDDNNPAANGVGKGGAKSTVLTPRMIQEHVDRHFPPFKDSADCSRLRPELHFTPDFSDMSVYGGPYADGKTTRYYHKKDGTKQRTSFGNHYVFNNKPNGLLHWAKAHENEDLDEAIVLIDPDFLFLTRFHLARSDMTIVGRNDHQKLRDRDIVHPGQPAAASYGLGAQWLQFDLVKICGKDSPCANTTRSDVYRHYSAGPPYVIHRKDVLPLATKWSELVPGTYDEYPLLYAEMFAYSMAAAHLQLRHNLVNNVFTGCMVGWPNPDRWSQSDKDMPVAETLAVKQSAQRYRDRLQAKLVAAATDKKNPASFLSIQEEKGPGSCFLEPLIPPPMLHYCQRYFIKTTTEMRQVTEYSNVTYRFFAKRRVDHNHALACGNDDDNDSNGDGIPRFFPFASTKDDETMAGGSVDWNTLSVCAITEALNFAKVRGCHRHRMSA
jgi:hypothetical protein